MHLNFQHKKYSMTTRKHEEWHLNTHINSYDPMCMQAAALFTVLVGACIRGWHVGKEREKVGVELLMGCGERKMPSWFRFWECASYDQYCNTVLVTLKRFYALLNVPWFFAAKYIRTLANNIANTPCKSFQLPLNESTQSMNISWSNKYISRYRFYSVQHSLSNKVACATPSL